MVFICAYNFCFHPLSELEINIPVMENIIFELNNVFFSYLGKYPALCGINVRIHDGEKIVLLGANGSGKSTFLQMLDGLIFSDKGTVIAFGKELSEKMFNEQEFSRFFRSKVGLVFQNPDIQLFCPTAREDIIFGPLQLGISESETKKRLDKVVSVLQIEGLLDRPPHQLSIGEKRKVAIASVLAIEPDVLLLDEPTAGLDPATTRQIIDWLIEANNAGRTIVTATHDLHIVEEIADYVYVFNQQKRLIRTEKPAQLLTDTQFLEENNLLHVHSHRHQGALHKHLHQHLEHHH